MQFSPLAIKRRYILGNLAGQCETVNKIPVYLNDKSEPPIGFADESLGRYADAFLFHLPEEICKRLATNGYELDIDYEVHRREDKTSENARIKLNHIILTSRAVMSRIPKRGSVSRQE
jgi:hypothetical protein